ncbi:Serine/Threonine protein kinase [Raphidiopsis brookii D9]|nr:Serine/Threonine protein kinase [Raphidiopsis brookii D9]
MRYLVEMLDNLIDEVGEDETHPLASLMEIIGVLIEQYENQNIPETFKANDRHTTNMPQVFSKLNSLLQAQNFKQADRETRKIMLAIAKREEEGWLRIEDAEKFPCKELRSIDQLWLKYSGGKFGISVQQQIYQRTLNMT